MPTIKYEVSAFGETITEVLNGDGTSCELLTKTLDEAIAKSLSNVNTEYKPEYYNGDKEQEAHVTTN